MSRADVFQSDLAESLSNLTKKYDIDPKLLHLEITESAYTENSKQIISMVDQLRARGFIIEMDDFGSGYSSLNMLSQLKLDVLKLDMKFVQSETGQGTDRGVLRLVVEEDPRSRKLLKDAFDEIYEVVVAADCAQALTFLGNHAQELAAMILSSTLPEPGAAVVVSTLRRVTAPRRIPIMLMTPPQRALEQPDQNLDVDDTANKPRDLLCLHCLRRRVEWMNVLNAYQTKERSMVSEACRDYLTGLLNRRGLQAALDSVQRDDYPMAVYLFDLDNLKEANERLGHGAGDRILKHFADVLRRNTRSGDVLCRYGSDEFAVILKGMRSTDAVTRKGADICQGIAQLQFPEGYSPTCTGGVALCVERTCSPPSSLNGRTKPSIRPSTGKEAAACFGATKGKIHTVFPRFRNFEPAQNLSLSFLAE